jgi:hypothetical protein
MSLRLVKSLLLGVCGMGAMLSYAADFDEDYEVRQWQEIELLLPAAPKQEAMQPFYVSAASSNRFSVDRSSLNIGSDGVVRYVLQVDTPGGARNITFEGMRCETRERRIYASGRLDGRWSKARNSAWERIRDIPPNRQHAALFLDYFCPGGVIAGSVAEVQSALLAGGHPRNRLW